jgi:AcrR family transcriptional regulator
MKNQTASRRPRGRPPADQGDLRKALLDAAEELFARGGFAATSVRSIAEQAGVNPAMVHYYFGSKQALLQAVLKRTLLPLAEAIASLKSRERAPVSEISRLLMSMAAQHPNLPSLIAREVLLPGGQLQDLFLENFAPRLGGAFPELIRHEQSRGRVSQRIDPRLGSLMILSLSIFPFIARNLAGKALDIGYDEAGLQRMSDQVAQLLERGFKP